ncbi:hypothetical protein D0Y65_000862 [Glycine soja]|uniref:F-box domain-containing protein n=1 Tax=Glycine soja TaxID=3848 RepID=A0A445M0M5_GLYSO|nr:hypothetical protein D0Y65_000862 [Glycine soja]
MKKVDRFLNSGILIEILSHVPAKDLLSLKRVCKEWHHVISSRCFVEAQLQRTKEEALNGFIFQEKFMWCNEDIKTISYISVEVTTKGGSKLEWPWPITHYDRNNCLRSMVLALAFDFDPSKGFVEKFKLVRVKLVEVEGEEEEAQEEEEEGEGELFITFELYSSEKGAWKTCNEICQCYNMINNGGIYIGGVMHWLNGDNVLTFNVENELSWLVLAPVPASEFMMVPEACIGESEGRLHYVVVSEQGVHVWCLEDYYDYKWAIVYCKPLEEIEGEWPLFLNLKSHALEKVNGPWVNPLAFKDGLLLIKVCVSLYLFDVKNNSMTKACSIQDLKSQCMFNPTVIAHSLSLVHLSPA